jgi:O-acetyl-ADP-ribose deacetylase (regulator of RNase III)
MKVKIHRTSVECVRGDITQQDTDAIVNAANSALTAGGGLDGAIRRAAGDALDNAIKKILLESPGCPTGAAVITVGGNLKAKWVIHAVGPIWEGGQQGEPELLAGAYRTALKLADGRSLASIAFPAISTGAFGYPLEAAARVASQTVIEYIRAKPETTIQVVRFVLFDDKTADMLGRVLISLLPTKRY